MPSNSGTIGRSAPLRPPGRPRKKAGKHLMGLSPKVKAAIELMIFGALDTPPLPRPQAAKAVGLADVSLRTAFRNPLVIHHYNQQLDVLRTSERPRALHTIAELRDKAKSERVQLEAAKYLDGGHERQGGVTVNVGVNIEPGYQIAIAPEHADGARQLLQQAGSTRNLLIDKERVPDESPERET